MALIVQHPSSPVTFDHLRDPRDPLVVDPYPQTPETIARAKAARDAERRAIGYPVPDGDHPFLLALRGDLPAGRCAGCREPIAAHFDNHGERFIGCALARNRRTR